MRANVGYQVLIGTVLGAVISACAHRAPTTGELRQLLPRGHHELAFDAKRSALPVYVGPAAVFQACVVAEISDETSRWEGRLAVDDAWGDFAAPTLRLDTTLCFDVAKASRKVPGVHELCAEVRDGWDRRVVANDCWRFEYRESDPILDGLFADLDRLVATNDTDPLVHANKLTDLAQRAEEVAHPLFAVRARLVAVYLLRGAGTPKATSRAEQILAIEPGWLALPAAMNWAAQQFYEKGVLNLERRGDERSGWAELRLAERYSRITASPKFVAVSNKLAKFLSASGMLEEARGQLETALSVCERFPCQPTSLESVRQTVAWVAALDPMATDQQLVHAEELQSQFLAADAVQSDQIERANSWVNVAFLRMRRGADVDAALAQVAVALEHCGSQRVTRVKELRDWGRLIAGFDALRRGNGQKAHDGCSLASDDSADVKAWSASCRARALQLLGRTAEALDEFTRALAAHRQATIDSAVVGLTLGPGQRAEDFYEAARLWLEHGNPRAAWTALSELDQLTPASPVGRSHVTDRLSDAQRPGWLADPLTEFTVPAAERERAEHAVRERLVRVQIQHQVRARATENTALPIRSTEPQFRVFATNDRVIVLQRLAAGVFRLYRESRYPRNELMRDLVQIRRGITERDLSDELWRQRTDRLARAVLPDRRDVGAVATIALYGQMQGLPLSAFPLPDVSATSTWFGPNAVLAVVPAGAMATESEVATDAAEPLFVVNPTGDLPHGMESAGRYRKLFPRAAILSGAAATRPALARALRAARWLHVDAHGNFDPAFPELSTIEMADGPLVADDFPPFLPPLRLVNLSGCGTARWPVTADSGRYGLAGEFARWGVPWVIATSADLRDDLAALFNDELYSRLAAGVEVPQAFKSALGKVANRFRAVEWAPLMLFHACEQIPGETTHLPTPKILESRNASRGGTAFRQEGAP